jgi:D-alanyl-D-alanine carboxypeptidase
MNSSRFRLFVPVLAALLLRLALGAVPVGAATASPATADELARYADKLMTERYAADKPGAAILVAKDGKVVLRKGYGLAEVELGVPVRPEMVFELGSVTKQFTATAILMLQERGKLSVQDEVTKYLPGYPTHGQKITLEHLLTHVSGIPSYTGLPEWPPKWREDLTVDQLMALFKDKPLEFNPGDQWAYSNSAYILLGAVIEKVSGKSYEDFVEQEIFAPLGMTHSVYNHNEELLPGRVAGYEPDAHGFHPARYLSMTHPYAAGSLMSSVDDLWLWEQGLASGKVLRPESLDRMFTPAKLNSGVNTNYAFGWGVFEYNGRKVMAHGGGIFGFVTHVARVPDEKLYVAVLSNNPSIDPGELGTRIVAKAIGPALEDRPSITLDEKTLDEYVAVYRFDPTMTRTVTRTGNKLYSQRSGGERTEILPAAKDEFFFRDLPGRVHFRRDAQGKVTEMDFLAAFGPDGFGARTDEAPAAERQAVQVNPALYDNYAGDYELAPGFHLTITREGDRIFAQATGQQKLEIFPASETEFFLRVVDAQITFERGADGKVSGLVLHQNGRDMPGKRVP